MNVRIVPLMSMLMMMVVGSTALMAGTAAAQESTPEAETSVMVGDTEVSWADGWRRNSNSSSENLVTLLSVDSETGQFLLLTYSTARTESQTSANAVIDGFAATLEGSDIGNISEAKSGNLDDGHAWRTFRLDLQGLPLAMLVVVELGDDGEYVLSSLTSTSERFDDAVAKAQTDISLDGELTFLEGIDPLEVAPPPATPAIWPGGD